MAENLLIFAAVEYERPPWLTQVHMYYLTDDENMISRFVQLTRLCHDVCKTVCYQWDSIMVNEICLESLEWFSAKVRA